MIIQYMIFKSSPTNEEAVVFEGKALEEVVLLLGQYTGQERGNRG